jgi:hypothetical protein
LLNRARLFEVSLPFRCSSGSNEDPAKTGVGLPDIFVSVYSATFGECNCLPEEPLRALIFLSAVGIQSQVQPGFR